jgi:hypothetical protein
MAGTRRMRRGVEAAGEGPVRGSSPPLVVCGSARGPSWRARICTRTSSKGAKRCIKRAAASGAAACRGGLQRRTRLLRRPARRRAGDAAQGVPRAHGRDLERDQARGGRGGQQAGERADNQQAHPRARRARHAQPLQGGVPAAAEGERRRQARGQGGGRCARAAPLPGCGRPRRPASAACAREPFFNIKPGRLGTPRPGCSAGDSAALCAAPCPRRQNRHEYICVQLRSAWLSALPYALAAARRAAPQQPGCRAAQSRCPCASVCPRARARASCSRTCPWRR